MRDILAWHLLLFAITGSCSRLESCRFDCPQIYQCFQRGNCPFGSELDYCNCCNICLKGPQELCGGPGGLWGKCSEGFFCDKSTASLLRRVMFGNPVGVCRNINDRVNCQLGQCDRRQCPRPTLCPNGLGHPLPCDCCDACAKGIDDECGRNGRCGEGLYCDGPYPGFNQTSGACRPWTIFNIIAANGGTVF